MDSLRKRAYKLHFRISLDHFEASQHDVGRGEGMFAMALEGLRKLYAMGFVLSVANQVLTDVPAGVVAKQFAAVFRATGLPEDLLRIEFPEFYPPETAVFAPQITQSCMADFQTEKSHRDFMCGFSRLVVKINGQTKVYACTLVDDDPDYAVGKTLAQSLQVPVSMKHHRCYSCFRFGASCREMK